MENHYEDPTHGDSATFLGIKMDAD